jgi:hypothetical protein
MENCPNCGEKEAGYIHCAKKSDQALFWLALGGIILGAVMFLVLRAVG